MVGKRKVKPLDLMKGYHQVWMEVEPKAKAAFTCHLGHYQYQRMPFDLTNVPAASCLEARIGNLYLSIWMTFW